jgi:hypothetical protein
MTCREVAEDILRILKENHCTIRGYEGEICAAIIEKEDEYDSDDEFGSAIENGTQNII